jgi:hypothetical protein
VKTIVTRKTSVFREYMAAIRTEALVFDALLSVNFRRAAAAYRLETHILKNGVLDRFVTSFDAGHNTKILYGAAKIAATGRGDNPVPVMGIMRRFRRIFGDRLVLVDEYGTTKHCSRCLNVLTYMKEQKMTTKRTQENNTAGKLIKSRGLQRCTSCSGRLVARDHDAAILIDRCYVARPACCRRRSDEDP